MYLDLGAAFYEPTWSAILLNHMKGQALCPRITNFRLCCPFDRFLKTGWSHLWLFLEVGFSAVMRRTEVASFQEMGELSPDLKLFWRLASAYCHGMSGNIALMLAVLR